MKFKEVSKSRDLGPVSKRTIDKVRRFVYYHEGEVKDFVKKNSEAIVTVALVLTSLVVGKSIIK